MEDEPIEPARWAAVEGRWEFTNDSARYVGPVDPNSPIPHGVALSNIALRRGTIETQVRFFDLLQNCAGAVVFGYNAATREYLSAGLGGHGLAYVLDEFLPVRGWTALGAAGTKENLLPNTLYTIEAAIQGQRVILKSDGIRVVEHNLRRPLPGDQVGLFAWGPGPIEFRSTKVTPTRPKVFVVMQFGEPYDALYEGVIKPVAAQMGLDAYRSDDVYRPGIILQDIVRGLVEAEVVVAEITPPNPNVFYEVGYAHAMDKTTILLAERGNQLPFDIRSYRCIFYDNTIRGKEGVENHLRQHLANILRET